VAGGHLSDEQTAHPRGGDSSPRGGGGQPSPELLRLAAEGHELRRGTAAREAERAEDEARRERRELDRLGRGYIRNALADSPRGSAPPLLAISMVLVVAGTLLLMLGKGSVGTAGLVMVLASALGYFPARMALGVWQVRLERAWLASLPFPVRGYFRVLGTSPEEERTLRLKASFTGSGPGREVLEGLLGRVSYPASANLRDFREQGWSAESGPILSPSGDDIDSSNAPTLGWMRVVIEDVLLPLHREFPLAAVSFLD
jgi:hypothetical protein